MENNTYSAKDIIFGLQEEYVKIIQELEKINQYIELCNPKVQKPVWYRSLDGDGIFTDLTIEKTRLEKIWQEIKEKLNLDIAGKNLVRISKKYDYEIKKKKEYIAIKDKEGLAKQIDKIYSYEFTKQKEIGLNYNEPQGSNFHLAADPLDVSIIERNQEEELSPIKGSIIANYTENMDTININLVTGRENGVDLSKFLNARFKKEEVPQYYRDIIEAGEDIQRELIIPKEQSIIYERTKYAITREPKKLILTKIKHTN